MAVSLALQVAVQASLFQHLGEALIALGSIPIVVSAWLFGVRGGLLAILAIFPFNVLGLGLGSGVWSIGAAIEPVGYGAGTLSALVVGALSTLSGRLRAELDRRAQIEEDLLAAGRELEDSVDRGSLAVGTVGDSFHALGADQRDAAALANLLRSLVPAWSGRLQYERMVAECAAALLASAGDDALEDALEVLRKGTGVTGVAVDEIIDGFKSSPFVAGTHVAGGGDVPVSGHVTDSAVRQALAAGGRVVVDGEGRCSFEVPASGVELILPISSGGDWTGALRLSAPDARVWLVDEVRLLGAIAAMIGSFWSRRRDQVRLEELLRSKDEFLASVSHELRTPLTAVLGFAAALAEDEDAIATEEGRDFLRLITQEGHAVAGIVEDLLVASRAELGNVAVVRVPTDLRQEIGRVLEVMLGGEAISVEGSTLTALADPDRVRQILRNLVVNALKYGGPHVAVRTKRVGDQVAVEVVDDGPGLPEEAHERIFEPYGRAHNRPGIPDSLGLGLAISRTLAERMAGSLAYSYEGGESIFCLRLPSAMADVG